MENKEESTNEWVHVEQHTQAGGWHMASCCSGQSTGWLEVGEKNGGQKEPAGCAARTGMASTREKSVMNSRRNTLRRLRGTRQGVSSQLYWQKATIGGRMLCRLCGYEQHRPTRSKAFVAAHEHQDTTLCRLHSNQRPTERQPHPSQ